MGGRREPADPRAAGVHPKDRNEMEDPRRGLRHGRAGLEASDAHPAPDLPGQTNAAAQRRSANPQGRSAAEESGGAII